MPPEVISGQIHSGPGAASLQAAASAWDGLAGALQSAAGSYRSVISELTGESWEGPASASMAAAAAPYVAWISATAAQAEETASQARAAVSAYEAVLAATVAPAVVAANRSQLAALVATNIFGQNGAAIAATEAEYGQMWAQDVGALFGYAGSSAAAGELTQFTEPPPTTNDAGAATQSAAATTSSTLSSSLTQVENSITSLTTGYNQFWEQLITGVTGNSQVAPFWETLYSTISGVGTQAGWTNVVNGSASLGISQWKNFFVYQPWSGAKSSLGAGLGSPKHVAGGPKAAAMTLGNAPKVGALSVPASWATATPAIRLTSALPGTSLAAPAAADFAANLVNEATLGSFAGGALGSPAARALGSPATRVVATTGIQARAVTGERCVGPVKLDRVIAQLQEQPDQVQHWSVDEAGLDELVARLTTTPGVHAVHVTENQPTAITEGP